MPNLFRVTDVFGDEVCLSDERWSRHILGGHPEVAPYLSEIAETLQRPQVVCASTSDPDAKEFFRLGLAQGRYRRLYLKVIVSYAADPAQVKTAYFTSGLSGGTILWITMRP